MSSGLPILDNIAKYLHGILRPLYDDATRSTTFKEGIDAVFATENFACQNHLRASTYFAVLEVKQLETIFRHSKAIVALQRFLAHHAPSGTTCGLSHQTIVFLVGLVLRTQYFTYNQHLYRQKRGGDCSSLLIRLLADIYLWDWQHELVNILIARYEVFGRYVTDKILKSTGQIGLFSFPFKLISLMFLYRCFNQMFLTWNDSPNQLHALLDTIERQRPDLPFDRSVSCSVHYLDVNIKQVHGRLRTRIQRSNWSEPLTLTFLKALPLQYYETKIRSLLVAAVQASTHLDDFQQECDNLLHMCVLNRMPYNLIDDGLKCLHSELPLWSASASEDQHAYRRFRARLIASTRRRTSSIFINGKRPRSDDLDVHHRHGKKRRLVDRDIDITA
jgi:hypothetical protein